MDTPRLEHASAGAAGIQPRPAYLERGDVFRTLGLPGNFIVGLDAMAMTTNKSLPGFRDIPPGTHFLWVQQPGGVSRCGYWFTTGVQGIVRIKAWDRYNEVLGEPAGQIEAQDRKDSMESLYTTLQPYTLHDRRDDASVTLDDTLPDWAQSPTSLWSALTGAISTQSLGRMTGKQGVKEYLVDSMDCARETAPRDGPPASKAHDANAINELNFLFAQDFRDLQVLDLGSMKAHVADTSAHVQALLSNDANNSPVTERDMLAELQFTFLTGSHLSNWACLEQWWNLVLKVVLRGYNLAVSRPQLARDLLQTLHAQLFYTEHYMGGASTSPPDHPGDPCERGAKKVGLNSDRPIFQCRPLNREKLRQILAEYKRQLNKRLEGGRRSSQVTPDQEAVGRAWEDLETWLWRCGWDLRGEYKAAAEQKGVAVTDSDEEEEEDEQPVVVELDDEGREVGLVSFRD
ncbi:A1 cistron-splicing factor [Chaetomidium leptoderma]|uniref:A1 cistron-splicing factor n=1 Tax=Chaetomidium leptoderma TaxID=669021 RepID=A0AAN6VJF3_9PEZI|nr:A1 cistron-splicing factor [Chaetomidium leptoderma]